MNPSGPAQPVPPRASVSQMGAAAPDLSIHFIRIQALKYEAWAAYIAGRREQAFLLAGKIVIEAQTLRDSLHDQPPRAWLAQAPKILPFEEGK